MATWVLLLAVLAALAVVVVVPRLAGGTAYTVLTGSMAPGMPPGTLVVVRPTDPEEIGVGTVITYQLASDRPDVVTHRVIAQGLGDGGEPVFQTRGDANAVPDRAWVRPVQVRGAEWYAVPYLGHVSNLLTRAQRELGIDLLAVLLLGYAVVLVGAGFRERRAPAGRRVRSVQAR